MDNRVVVKNTGATFPVLGLLGVIFVLLKLFELTAVATWPWWLVLMPFWIGLAVVIGFLVIGFAGVGVFLGVAWIIDKIRNR